MSTCHSHDSRTLSLPCRCQLGGRRSGGAPFPAGWVGVRYGGTWPLWPFNGLFAVEFSPLPRSLFAAEGVSFPPRDRGGGDLSGGNCFWLHPWAAAALHRTQSFGPHQTKTYHGLSALLIAPVRLRAVESPPEKICSLQSPRMARRAAPGLRNFPERRLPWCVGLSGEKRAGAWGCGAFRAPLAPPGFWRSCRLLGVPAVGLGWVGQLGEC